MPADNIPLQVPVALRLSDGGLSTVPQELASPLGAWDSNFETEIPTRCY